MVALVCMTDWVKGNKFRWQGVYHGGPAHLSVIMGTASFWWVIKVPYHKLSVWLNFADWARNSLY